MNHTLEPHLKSKHVLTHPSLLIRCGAGLGSMVGAMRRFGLALKHDTISNTMQTYAAKLYVYKQQSYPL